MAFAHKAKKKTRTSKSSSRKNQADPDFFTSRPIFSRKLRYFLPSVPHFLEQLRYTNTNSTASP